MNDKGGTALLARLAARVQIFLLIFLCPWLWGAEAAAQQKGVDTESVFQPLEDSVAPSPSATSVTGISIRPPVWGEEFVPILVALREPGPTPLLPARTAPPKPQDSGSTAKKSSSLKWILIAAAGGGAAAAFALKGSGGGGGGGSSSSSATIAAGPPTVGPPVP